MDYSIDQLTKTHAVSSFFFFNDTATTEIYTLSLHDALPICDRSGGRHAAGRALPERQRLHRYRKLDRKSTRLNSSHGYISYAVFCLKKKNAQGLAAKDWDTSQQPKESLLLTNWDTYRILNII